MELSYVNTQICHKDEQSFETVTTKQEAINSINHLKRSLFNSRLYMLLSRKKLSRPSFPFAKYLLVFQVSTYANAVASTENVPRET